MTPKQKYLFDLTGYLHLKNVLTAEEFKQDPNSYRSPVIDTDKPTTIRDPTQRRRFFKRLFVR
ncbi:MAG: hypothetical protein VX432_01120 [Candidatus Poribacteria bacterium]|nr:hypothetical protein [Candidatus Poribacteria bacterium]